MRKTRSWKHNGKQRHQYGNTNGNRKASPFMTLDEEMVDIWETEMGYDNTDDGIEEEV